MNLRILLLPLAGALFASLLGGCASTAAPGSQAADRSAILAANSGVQTKKDHRFLGFLSPFRPDIEQGNFVSREMVAQLREALKSKGGVTPEQARFVMGTPLLTDVFHKDRWDYPFMMEKSNGDVISSRVTLYFVNNRLERIEGGDLPTEQEYIRLIASDKPPVDAKAPAINK